MKKEHFTLRVFITIIKKNGTLEQKLIVLYRELKSFENGTTLQEKTPN